MEPGEEFFFAFAAVCFLDLAASRAIFTFDVGRMFCEELGRAGLRKWTEKLDLEHERESFRPGTRDATAS